MPYNLIFLDTETTGNEAKDFLCQIAYAETSSADKLPELKDIVSKLYKPPVPIAFESMAVHHITTKMVADKPAFKYSLEHAELHKKFENENTIVVAHNAIFDLGMLKKEDLSPKKFICTLRLAHHLDTEEKITSYKLQVLRYMLDLDVEATAHDAGGDVLVLIKLFDRMYKKMLDKNNGDSEKTIEEMVEISAKPILIRTFRFGKHNGKKVEEVAKTDRAYLEWLLAQKESAETDDVDWIFTLRTYLGKLDLKIKV